jgi:hypothetical protein
LAKAVPFCVPFLPRGALSLVHSSKLVPFLFHFYRNELAPLGAKDGAQSSLSAIDRKKERITEIRSILDRQKDKRTKGYSDLNAYNVLTGSIQVLAPGQLLMKRSKVRVGLSLEPDFTLLFQCNKGQLSMTYKK